MNILITGATSGIGFLTGITLCDRGHNVYMTTHTDNELIILKNKLKRMGLNINTFKLDITNKNDLNKIKSIDIDVLINHAGIGIGGSIIDLDINKVKHNFDVNFFSSYRLLQMVCKKFIKENKRGKLIITSSIAGTIPIEFLGSYCSSKAAITMMAKCLNKELKYSDKDISVSIIEPGAYKTGFNKTMIDNIELSMNKESIFYNKKYEIIEKLTSIFNLIEKKDLFSIVEKIILAVEGKNNKLIYKAPLLQSVFSRLYVTFFK